MSRLLILLLSIIILSESTGFNPLDIAKTGFLIEHAQYHFDKHGDSFWEFMSSHYGLNKEKHKDENNEHQRLPFQQTSICSCVMHIEEKKLEIASILIPPAMECNKFFFYKNLYASIATNDIFQPPKTT